LNHAVAFCVTERKEESKKGKEENMEINKKKGESLYKLRSNLCGTINGSEGSRSIIPRYKAVNL
jgi:hypothetical protein